MSIKDRFQAKQPGQELNSPHPNLSLNPGAANNPLNLFIKHWGLIVSIAVSLGAYGGLISLHLKEANLNNGSVPFTLAWYALAFAAYLGAIAWVEWRKNISPAAILAAALVFRILLLFTVPTLSSDVYRYIWDGYVANNGVSPYAHAIDAPALDYLDNPLRAQANHAWMASPYLPAAQFLFAGLTGLFPPHPFFFQAAMVIFDLLAGLLLIGLLNIAGLPGYRGLIYLWNPLAVVEVAHGAHMDAWMIFLMMLALWLTFTPCYPKISPWLGPLVLALAILTKGLPVLLLAILFWCWRWWQTGLCGIVVLIILALAALRPGWGLTGPLDGTGLFGALRIYSDRWNFNSGLFHWLEVGLQDYGLVEANAWAKRAILTVILVVLIGVWIKARSLQTPQAILRMMSLPFMACILLTTTVHPWYLLILLVFIPFLPPAPTESHWRWRAVAPWVYLSGAIMLSYVTYLNPLDLREYEWVRNAEWLPALGLLLGWVIFNVFNIFSAAQNRGL